MSAATVAVESLRSRLARLAGGAAQRRRARADATSATAAAQWVLLAVGGLALWLVAYAFVLSSLQEQHSQHDLYASYREQLVNGTAPIGGAMAEGAPVALLHSARASMDDLVVVEGTASSDLRLGPGHYPGTVLPGQAGVSVMFGRSLSFGAPFGSITSLRPGDVIDATTGQGVSHYVVEDVRRAGDPYPPVLAAGQGRLTLVSSEGSGWRAGWAPSSAVYVDARLRGSAVPAPSGVGQARQAERPMAGDTSGLYPLVLWLQLLLVAVVGVVVLRRRWGVWQTWLVTVPLVLAALWGASSSAWLLLPNLV
ncbi:MAG: class E sortase [Jatrophihabitans sp.]|uniref:class E sortase n=1 Tax=Jatrophihabitans sp. TaxID=1932789 RepID=UPI003F7DC49A